ncbi:MAG: S-layer homology domain-containing protein [Ruminococcaceae bacterium]|nr:S-layer homology domain-containing protein [Oscillospiraceae bacterium]
MKKILVSILIGVMFISSLSVSASANFSDVKETDWYYSQVMAMTEKGLLVGKGNNLFCPDDTMTRAEFITVVVRALYPNIDISSDTGEKWWQGAYEVAVEKGLVLENEVASSGSGKTALGSAKKQTINLDQPIQRQMMAMISVRALNTMGETDIKPYTYIPDINTVGTYYRDYVCKAYGSGIIMGDEKGNFNPQSTLTRAEASTVLYRIIEKSARASIDFNSLTSDTQTQSSKPSHVIYDGTSESTAPITIKEGEVGFRRFAREGDTVIKADGTSVVLKKGPHGILGEGQGVAPDLGVQTNDGATWTVTNKNESKVNFSGKSTHLDSTGFTINNQAYHVNELTGEGHWGAEWQVMTSAPKTSGTFDFQLSSDKNWIWNADTGEWSCAYIQNFSDQVIQIINQANGL